MKELKIEVGKFYRTRDGRKVRIYATDGEGKYPVHGAIQERKSDNRWSVKTWTENGLYWNDSPSDANIVSEWKPTLEEIGFDPSCLPAWANKYIAKDSDCMWCAYKNKPVRGALVWGSEDSSHIYIPKDFAPKNFTGDWTESLFEIK